ERRAAAMGIPVIGGAVRRLRIEGDRVTGLVLGAEVLSASRVVVAADQSADLLEASGLDYGLLRRRALTRRSAEGPGVVNHLRMRPRYGGPRRRARACDRRRARVGRKLALTRRARTRTLRPGHESAGRARGGAGVVITPSHRLAQDPRGRFGRLIDRSHPLRF